MSSTSTPLPSQDGNGKILDTNCIVEPVSRAIGIASLGTLISVVVMISFIKKPLGIPIFLNVLPLVLGISSVFVCRSIKWPFFLMLSLPLCSVVATLQADSISVESILRASQLFTLVLFSILVSKTRAMPKTWLLSTLLILTLFVFLIETLQPRYSREVLGLSITRFSGLYGEPNYNAIVLAAFGLFAAFSRNLDKRNILKSTSLGLLLISASLLSFSRGAMLGIAAFFVCWHAYSYSKALGRCFTLIVFSAGLMWPLLLYVVLQTVDRDFLFALNRISSGRFVLWDAYLRMSIENPLGKGFFVGQSVVESYIDLKTFPQTRPQQAHSLHLNVLSDFGFFGFLLFQAALFALYLKCRHSQFKLSMICFLLSSYFFLNALGEVIFWYTLGLLLSSENNTIPSLGFTANKIVKRNVYGLRAAKSS